MSQSFSKAQPHAIVGLEELVGEVLSKECKHEVSALGVGSENFPFQ